MRRFRYIATAVAALAATATVAACASSSASSAGSSGSSGYKIGVVLPYSGVDAADGQIYTEGIKLAVNLVNEKNLLGAPLSVNYQDSAGEVPQSVTALQQLSRVDNIQYVISGFTGPTLGMQPLAAQQKVVLVNGGATSPVLKNLPYLYNVTPFLDGESVALLDYLKANMPSAKRMAVIYEDDALGNSVFSSIDQTWTGGGRSVVSKFPVSIGASSFGALVSEVQASKPDLVFMVYTGSSESALIDQLKEGGVTATIVGPQSILESATTDPKAEGVIYSAEALPLTGSDTDTKEFVAAFHKAYPSQSVNQLALNYYNAVLLYVDAVAKLKADDLSYSGANLNKVLSGLSSFVGVGGNLKLSADHTITVPLAIYKIANGKAVVVSSVK